MDQLGISKKIIVIPVSVGVIVSIVVFFLAERVILQSQKEQVQVLALVVAQSIDPSQVERLMSEKNISPDNSVYMELHKNACAIVKNASVFHNTISRASILVPTQTSAASGFDFLVSSLNLGIESNSMRVPFQSGDHAIEFEMNGQPTQVGVRNNAEGSCLIGYAPLLNVSGKSIGLVAIELNRSGISIVVLNLFLFSIATGLIVGGLASVLLNKDAKALQAKVIDREEHDFLIQMLGEQLSNVTDVDLLLHKILNSSLEFSKCEAGSIWIMDQDQLVLWYARNLVLESGIQEKQVGIVNARISVTSNSIAGYCALTKKQVVLDDVYDLPAGSPFHFDQSFDEKTKFRTRCIISIPLLGAHGAMLGVMQLINPADHTTVSDTPLVERVAGFAILAGQVLERASNAKDLLMRLVRTAEVRDPYETGVHVQRVSGVACHLYKLLADKRQVPPHVRDQNISVLRVAACLHDIGKVGIPDAILKKPGKLDEHEYNLMKWHTVIGAKLFDDSESPLEKAASEVALHAHERWDGTGYPGALDLKSMGRVLEDLQDVPHLKQGLKGEEIPLFARLVGIADVFDALASHRVYKEPWSDEQIVSEIRKGSGTQFDPAIVEIFLKNYDDLKAIRERFQIPRSMR